MVKLIFALLFLAGGVIGGSVFGKMNPLSSNDNTIISRTIRFGGIAVAVLILLFSIFRVIPAGHVGVPVLFGEVIDVSLPEGLNITNPFWDVTRMSVRVLKHQEKYDAASKDQQVVHIDMALNYRLIPTKASEVYQSIGADYETVIIIPAAQEVLKSKTAQHNVSEILKQREMIKADVQTALAVWLAKYNIELKEVSIANISFDPEYAKAVEAAQIAERESAERGWKAQALVNEKKGEGDAAEAKARGDSAAKRLLADAEDYYNKKVSASLTPLLIQQQFLHEWNGEYPSTYIGGGGSGVFLQLPVPTPSELKK